MSLKYRQEDWLREKYYDEMMSTREMAQSVDVSEQTIRNWMHRNEIEMRDKTHIRAKDCRQNANKDNKASDEEWLREMYIDNGKSIEVIANKANVTKEAVRYWMKKHGINRRNMSESQRDKKKWSMYPKLKSKEWLKNKYLSEGKSSVEIGKVVGCHPMVVLYWLSRHGIETRGTPHYEKGDSEVWKRASDQEIVNETVRKRDDYTCQDCGVTQDEHFRALDVHHKDKIEQFKEGDNSINWVEANDMDNLVTLCRACHAKRHLSD